jgi:hypothetical protein
MLVYYFESDPLDILYYLKDKECITEDEFENLIYDEKTIDMIQDKTRELYQNIDNFMGNKITNSENELLEKIKKRYKEIVAENFNQFNYE